jgi:hypothetical protein
MLEEETRDTLECDGKNSLNPEQAKRPNPWSLIMMTLTEQS